MGRPKKSTISRRQNIKIANIRRKNNLQKEEPASKRETDTEPRVYTYNTKKPTYFVVKTEKETFDEEQGNLEEEESQNEFAEVVVVVKKEVPEDHEDEESASDHNESYQADDEGHEQCRESGSNPTVAGTGSSTTAACQNRHCLLCYKLVDKDGLVLTTDVAEANFNAMFVLRKMLMVPKFKLKEYLRTTGNPHEWIDFCRDCLSLVYNALRIQQDITLLEERLIQCQKLMVRAIKTSWNQELQKRSGPRLDREARVTNETRNFVSTKMKLKPCRPRVGETSDRLEEETHTTKLSYEQTRRQNIRSDKRDIDRVKPVISQKPPHAVSLETSSNSSSSEVDDSPTSPIEPLSPGPLPSPEIETSNGVARKRVRRRRRQKAVVISIENQTVAGGDEKRNSNIHTVIKKVQLMESPFESYPSAASPMSVSTKLKKQALIKSREPRKYTSDIDNAFIKLKGGNYACKLCPDVSAMPFLHYILHILFHFRRPYKCTTCGLYFSSVQELETNPFKSSHFLSDEGHICSSDSLEKVLFSPGKIWACGESTCSELFETDTDRNEHEKQIHGLCVPMDNECKICSCKFRNTVELLLHRALNHPEVATTSCFYCDESFKATSSEGIDVVDVYQMKTHIRKCHEPITNPEIPNVCDFCGAVFKKPTPLNLHVEQKHRLDNKCSYSCPVCYSRGRFWQGISRHLNLEHGVVYRESDETFFCDLCGFKVKTSCKVRIVEHRFRKHGIEPKCGKIYKCTNQDCSFQTTLPSYLKIHMMKEHEAPRPHICQICGKGFLRGRHLQEHEQIHVNACAKPFKCEICGNSFAVRNYLYIHKRLSHQNRPFASTNKKKKRPQKLLNSQSRSKIDKNVSLGNNGSQDTIPLPSWLPLPSNEANKTTHPEKLNVPTANETQQVIVPLLPVASAATASQLYQQSQILFPGFGDTTNYSHL